jgi:hypothetical protein
MGVSAPYVSVTDDKGQQLTIHWPEPKPESFEITASAFEALISEINVWRRLGQRLDTE